MNIETAKMSQRGQIIIPKEIREEVGALENTIFAVSAFDKNTIVMKKVDTTSLVKEFKKFRDNTKKLSPEKIGEEINESRKG
ncbi:MAG TPA: AbrB/MazE/SpoVT family DNA-binding domain-containing protein [Candidatus Nanoarchaeia archaeon]|nr:AbrB/MazE/SpoVT family DNA-binding domain-containing protein [Candidatus Nanoarchaeia archaeon]